jgi:hypothetical protein
MTMAQALSQARAEEARRYAQEAAQAVSAQSSAYWLAQAAEARRAAETLKGKSYA